MSECRKCWRDSVYRVKTVGGEFEAVTCGFHLPQVTMEALANSVPGQGKRCQVTYERKTA